MKKKLKKTIIQCVPYLFIGLFATKLGQMWRYTSGAELGERIMNLGEGFFLALESPLPSFHPFDLIVGIAFAVIFHLIVYGKSKNVKKYRRNEEYGSARWGKPEDIAPYVDPDFRNNVILTQTES
ncbi:MAG: type IV secretory system conjugative DNA transfer family protein, partial [Clostridia bacterium]|nr:type IV secretory system conjugative DNA transfer family protein [Clostridia bacterium]